MQSKGAIKFFAIAFALVSIFELSFTFLTRNTEKAAKEYATNEQASTLAEQYAKGDELLKNYYLDSLAKVRERYYLDSMANETVYNLGVRKYTYQECKEREINLGLDLKGGMDVMLEVSVVDIVRALSDNSQDETFVRAIDMALEKQKDSQDDFVTLFYESFQEIDANARLAAVFSTFDLKDRVKYNSTNDEVLTIIRDEVRAAESRTLNILRTRIDRFGVAQPNIQQLTSGRILVQLPGIKEPARVRKLLQGTAQLEFWETYKFNEIVDYFSQANAELAKINEAFKLETKLAEPEATEEKSEEKEETTSLIDEVKSDSLAADAQAQQSAQNPLYNKMMPAFHQGQNGQWFASQGSTVGYAAIKDTAEVNAMLAKVRHIFPRNLKLAWTVKPDPRAGDEILELVALKTSRDGEAALGGGVITNANQDYDQVGKVVVSMVMNAEGASIWKRLTADNIGKQIAVVLDGYVYSAPNVNSEIPTGRSEISGNFTIEEGKDLANILKSGKLPAPARIVQEDVVGPSLGKEAIDAGFRSFIIAFIFVLIYMVVYYNRAGWISNLALLTNMFFILGVLASFGAVLTLPGIAGIVLTIGMAVDANVIIFERIKEEIRAGKGVKLAVEDGYKNAYSAILDGNITTLLTGIVLYVFGSGPVQGFATTLIIGIISSLFTAILISRLIFNWLLEKNKTLAFSNKVTERWFTNVNIDFIGKRKTYYIVSAAVVILGLASLLTKGLNPGVDFTGGRNYVVRFDQDIKTDEMRTALVEVFGTAPEVKTFGPSKQVKITTKYLIEDNTADADDKVEAALYQGVKAFYASSITQQQFLSDDESKLVGVLSSSKVGPTIADDLLHRSYMAIAFALFIIFVYIAARFRKWQFGIGGLVTLMHDALITIAMYSIFDGILPFSLEVDQAFIAAILTIIGYSINDSVIIFDRIREYFGLYPKRTMKENINGAVNSTLGRTFMTSGTTLMVLLVIFILGGEVIRGFSFALIVGVVVGTYSSIFISTPVAYDLSKETVKVPANSKKNK